MSGFCFASGRCQVCGRRCGYHGDSAKMVFLCSDHQNATASPVTERPPVSAEVREAEGVRIGFGKYSNLTLGELVAKGREGLLYLDWLAGLTDIRRPGIREAIDVMHAQYSSEIDELVD